MYPRAVPYAFFFFAEKCSSNLWSTDDVWCGGTQRHARDAAARMSGCVPLQHAMWFFFFLANSCRSGSDLGRFALNRVDSSRIGQNSWFRPKLKKKKVRNTPFEPNIKPYFQLTSHKHTKQALCLSLTPSLVSHSLCALYLLLIVLLIIFYFVLVSNLWVVF